MGCTDCKSRARGKIPQYRKRECRTLGGVRAGTQLIEYDKRLLRGVLRYVCDIRHMRRESRLLVLDTLSVPYICKDGVENGKCAALVCGNVRRNLIEKREQCDSLHSNGFSAAVCTAEDKNLHRVRNMDGNGDCPLPQKRMDGIDQPYVLSPLDMAAVVSLHPECESIVEVERDYIFCHLLEVKRNPPYAFAEVMENLQFFKSYGFFRKNDSVVEIHELEGLDICSTAAPALTRDIIRASLPVLREDGDDDPFVAVYGILVLDYLTVRGYEGHGVAVTLTLCLLKLFYQGPQSRVLGIDETCGCEGGKYVLLYIRKLF